QGRRRAGRGTPLSDQQAGAARLAAPLAVNLRERAGRRAPRQPGVTSDAELWLAPDAWSDLRQRIADLLADLHDAAQPPHTPGTVPVGATVMVFPLDH